MTRRGVKVTNDNKHLPPSPPSPPPLHVTQKETWALLVNYFENAINQKSNCPVQLLSWNSARVKDRGLKQIPPPGDINPCLWCHDSYSSTWPSLLPLTAEDQS